MLYLLISLAILNLAALGYFIRELKKYFDSLSAQLETFSNGVQRLEAEVADLNLNLVDFINKPQIKEPKLVKNEIEEKEEEEIDLQDMGRIPILDGTKVRFEDEAEDKAVTINIE